VQEKLSRLKKEKRANIQKLQTRQQESKTVSNILLFINYLEQLSIKIEAQIRKLQKATQTVNQMRADLISIMKKRKTLEKLKEKEWLAYQRKLLHAERKFNDEVAATRHVRKR
jgi:flagellar export protein FliJ